MGLSELHRFWFEFEVSEASISKYPQYALARLGCGVTALDATEAERLISERVLAGAPLPPLKTLVVDVDISELDSGHVRPNMGVPTLKGVWFPRK
jgi:hypothetical protein